MEVREAALASNTPQKYPIPPNPRGVKYWKHIDELKNRPKENQVEINQLG